MDREDAAAIPWMAKYTRQTWPTKIVWRQDDVTHNRFYWLQVNDENKKKGTTVEASVEKNTITISSEDVNEIGVFLSDDFVNLDEEFKINFNGVESVVSQTRSIASICASLEYRWDRNLAGSVYLQLGEAKLQEKQ